MQPKKFKDLLEEHQVESDLEGELIEEVSLSKIKPNPNQPRQYFNDDQIEALAISISQHGLIQPIVLKPVKDYYMIISGERRYRAYKTLNYKTIPAVIRGYEDKKIDELALIENIQREDLNPLEEARAYDTIIKEKKYKHHELALKVGKSRSHIVNMLGLLKLHQDIQILVEHHELSMGHARALSKLSEKDALRLAKKVIHQALSVRQLEAVIQQLKEKPMSVSKTETKHLKDIEDKYQLKAIYQEGKITLSGDDLKIQSVIDILNKHKG
jgi:ParB family chromosome partitioning protein